MNISHNVTPNIQVSLAWEKVRVFRLSGAHLAEAGVKWKPSQSTSTHNSPNGHKMLIQKTCWCLMCQVQQQVLGTWYEADRAGHLDYVDHGLGENHLCSGLLTHMWLGVGRR